jgi:pimeloyl-ACP methyl ester carboxylesterase
MGGIISARFATVYGAWLRRVVLVGTPIYPPLNTVLNPMDRAQLGFYQQFYDYLKANAQRFLGTLYNDADYPLATDIISKFKMDMAVFPVPSNDFRVSIGSDELNRIQQDVERRVQEAQTTATRDVWQRLFDKVEKIAERLSDPTSKFRDSLIENAREMCELLPRLNFTDDPQLEAMRQEVETKLVSMSAEVLRSDPLVRRNTAADAKAIMDKMSVFMGAV